MGYVAASRPAPTRREQGEAALADFVLSYLRPVRANFDRIKRHEQPARPERSCRSVGDLEKRAAGLQIRRDDLENNFSSDYDTCLCFYAPRRPLSALAGDTRWQRRGGSGPTGRGRRAKGPEVDLHRIRQGPILVSRRRSLPLRTSGGHVTFEPGARSAWHSHPAGQDAHRHPGYRLGCRERNGQKPGRSSPAT